MSGARAEQPAFDSRQSEVFVLGSGESILDLTDEQKQYIARGTCVAMNKYLLFWEKVGIWPTHYFLADAHYPAIRVYQETYRIVRSSGNSVHYLLDSKFARKFGEESLGRQSLYANLLSFGHNLLKYRYLYKPWLHPSPVTYFKRPHAYISHPRWAHSIDEPLYFFRGSLTVLINLLTVLGLGRTIKLVGVDLNTDNFFSSEISRRPELFDVHLRGMMKDAEKIHPTEKSLNGSLPGICDKFPEVLEHVERSGFKLVCCNPDSLLVTKGKCDIGDVISGSADSSGRLVGHT